MRSSKPPALATWLVEHLIPRGKNEALAGDLLEQFSRGRSTSWYWHQVLAAILIGFARELSTLGVAVGFTGFWIGALLFYKRLYITPPAWSVFGWGVKLSWPVSAAFALAFFTAINAVPFLTAFGIYLGVMRSFSMRRISRGFLVGSLTYALTTTLGIMILPTMPHPGFVTYVIASLPFFFALLISMWTTRPNNPDRGADTDGKSGQAYQTHSAG